MRTRLLILTAVALLLGCSRPILKRGDTSLKEFQVQCPRNQVFDETLRVAQRRNLEVKVLEKSSGFIRFERTTLGPDDLDLYCVFPLVNPKTGQPVATFRDGAHYGVPNLGTVNLNILLSETSATSTAVSVRGNWSAGTMQLNSTGTLEDEFASDLATSAVCGASRGVVDPAKLARLEDLLKRGLITQEDFEQKKRTLEAK